MADNDVDTAAPKPEPTPGLTLAQFEDWHKEIKEQPPWRSATDRVADYFDGNQLDSDILRKQQSIGMPPAIEPLMGPALAYICGQEAKLRRDFRIVPAGDKGGDDVAEAINIKLNEAERHAKADKACSNAFRAQAGLGVGWVEVSRNPDPFMYRYRALDVHRNEIFYDWKGTRDPDMHDHRYLIRRRWTDKEQAKLLFPDKTELIEKAATGWQSFEQFTNDGGHSTGLHMSTGAVAPSYGAVTTPLPGDTQTSYPMLSSAYQSERGSSIEEQEWRDSANKRVALFEVWYRVWSRVLILRSPDGRVVEYDQANEVHVTAVAQGLVKPEYAVISKVRLSWWLGPHKLSDEPCPYAHNRIPYVPFWNRREDRTGVPYGLGRAWIYLQDTVNATLSKLRWGLSAVRTVRTEGATVDDDNTLRREVARSDADIVLTKNFTKDQHVFKVERDFQLTDQQSNMLNDSREGIKRVGAMGGPEATQQQASPFANADLVHQASLGQGELFDNFQGSRTEVGELLTSMIIEDMSGVETTVMTKGDVSKAPREIRLNAPTPGAAYLTNDVARTRLKVELEDVPASSSYRGQQLNVFGEAYKSTPTEFQKVLFPYMLTLMDLPNRDEAIKAVREASSQPTEEQIQQRIEEAVKKALMESDADFRMKELVEDARVNDAKIKKLTADAVAKNTEASFEAMQAAGVVIAAPQAAPVADEIMRGAGHTAPAPGATSPNIAAVAPQVPAEANPVPVTPGTHPSSPASGMTGIETPRLND
ncbi:MAG: hypothetical protein WC736_14630 [Gallionella sp.]|jgi:hypothetical protein